MLSPGHPVVRERQMREMDARAWKLGDHPSLELLELAQRDLVGAQDDLAAAQQAHQDAIADATTGSSGRERSANADGLRAIAQAKRAMDEAQEVVDDCKSYVERLQREQYPGYIPDEWR